MKGTGNVSKEQLERGVLALKKENAVLGSENEGPRAAVDQRDRAIERLERLLKYHANPDAPPSANSLEWKEEKRQKRIQRKGEQWKEDAPVGGRGGKKGHLGTSRRHSPERVVRHGSGRRRVGRRLVPDVTCGCGKRMEAVSGRVRDITEIRTVAEETRHVTGAARCACGRTREAPNRLPKKGNFGKRSSGRSQSSARDASHLRRPPRRSGP